MFKTIEKARHLGVIALERVGDYLELLKIFLEIQGQHLKKRIIRFVVVALSGGLSLIFLGLAIIITCWDTPYRVPAAWAVMAFYALIAFGAYMSSQNQAGPASALDTLRDEVQQDIKLMEDVV